MVSMSMHWLDYSTLTRRVRAEARTARSLIAARAGVLAIQFGVPRIALLPSPRFARTLTCDPDDPAADVRALPEALPLSNDTADLVLLVHTLETAADPRATVIEVARVLKGEGWLMVIGFRPSSLRGLLELPTSLAHRGRFVGPWRLRLLVGQAGLEWRGMSGLPTLSAPASRHLSQLFAGSFAAFARKREQGMNVIRPDWKPVPARCRRTSTSESEARHAG